MNLIHRFAVDVQLTSDRHTADGKHASTCAAAWKQAAVQQMHSGSTVSGRLMQVLHNHPSLEQHCGGLNSTVSMLDLCK